MKEQCKQAVAKALGKQSLSAQEATDIEARINETMRNMARKDRDNWRNLSMLKSSQRHQNKLQSTTKSIKTQT